MPERWQVALATFLCEYGYARFAAWKVEHVALPNVVNFGKARALATERAKNARLSQRIVCDAGVRSADDTSAYDRHS